MNVSEIFHLAQSANSGGSGRGISFYSTAATCGRRAVLQEIEKATAQLEAEEGVEELSGTGTGTAYHLLHEHCSSDGAWDARDGAYTPNFIEALRLFRGWKAAWGSMEEKYGAEVLGSEVDIEDAGELFGARVTGKIDKLIRIVNPAAAFASTGLHLMPGVYLVDYKALKSFGKNDELKYSSSLQGANYLALYNKLHPEEPAVGMLFDIILKHRELTRLPAYDSKGAVKKGPSFVHLLQTPGPRDVEKISALVHIGSRNFNENLANPSACIDFFSVCPFYSSGKCCGS